MATHFSSLSAFLQMGGYAAYVWPAYGIGLLVLVGNLVAPVMKKRKLVRQLREKYARET